MKITTTRRISQIFFFGLFLWFCIVSTVGDKWFQLRGWPVNMFLWLDPLVGISTALTTHTLFAPFLLSVAVLILTIVLGRFFCGWICPFGAIHHFVGFVANRKKTPAQKIKINQYHRGQSVKYYILIFILVSAAIPEVNSLLIGLLDPIPLVSRSVNLILLPIVDNTVNVLFATDRSTVAALMILVMFLAMILLNVLIPRFYCRYICPLGAMFGVFSRFAIWRIGKNAEDKINCKMCEKNCEGGCEPAGKIKISECVLCLNCKDDCYHNLISYQMKKSKAGEVTNPDIGRRGFLLSTISGVLAIPAVRLSGKIGLNWDSGLIRPPGALEEKRFLERCLKCGQCMRICPTNVLQPAGLDKGIEALWTPMLNNRIGSSGCQLNCAACGFICPTAAIRPISLDEKHGNGDFEKAGPIRLGTAFVDRSRCLPWAMDKPCIVCQENCPVSPKAIFTRTEYQAIRDGIKTVENSGICAILIKEADLPADRFGTGDYYLAREDTPEKRFKITANDSTSIIYLEQGEDVFDVNPGDKILIEVSLQRPYVDIEKCVGCGICEHECPVSGKRAIRVTAEGETRSLDRGMLLE